MDKPRDNLVKVIESVSEQIQILALNIAVAAAKMAHQKEITHDVNNKVSQLVNQATLAVKNMGYILRAASSDKPKQDVFADGLDIKVDSEMVSSIESSLQKILDDSQKILKMLDKIKQESLGNFGG